jgi:hypothetical protein
MRRLALAALVLVLLSRAGPVPALSRPESAVGESDATANGHTVMATGGWNFDDDQAGAVAVTFQCIATAAPDAVSTSVEPPSSGGCVLLRDSAPVAGAPGLTMLGPAAATASRATTTAVADPMTIQVCWSTYAAFQDGTLGTTSGCTWLDVVTS